VKYGDPILPNAADEVVAFDENLRRLVDDMFETMYGAPVLVWRLPRWGVLKRLFVMIAARKRKKQKVVLINGDQGREASRVGDEDVLVPGIFLEVRDRACSLCVLWMWTAARSPLDDGIFRPVRLSETDHLDGELFISYISPLKRDLTNEDQETHEQGDW